MRLLHSLVDTLRDEFRALLDKYAATSPKLFGSVAHGPAHAGSDIDILVEMDPADGNLLMRASGLMEETRALFDRDDIDVFPVQLLKHPISASALVDVVAVSRGPDQRIAEASEGLLDETKGVVRGDEA